MLRSYRQHGVCHHHHHILLIFVKALFWVCAVAPSAASESLQLRSLSRVQQEGSCLQLAALWQHLHVGAQPDHFIRQLSVLKQQVNQACWAQEQKHTHSHQQHFQCKNSLPLLRHISALYPGPPLQSDLVSDIHKHIQHISERLPADGKLEWTHFQAVTDT